MERKRRGKAMGRGEAGLLKREEFLLYRIMRDEPCVVIENGEALPRYSTIRHLDGARRRGEGWQLE